MTIGNRSFGNVGFMGSTGIGSQASMIQGITQSAGFRRVIDTFGGAMPAINRMAEGSAVDISKQIGRGDVYGGNLPRAMGVAGIGEQRTMADMETFRAVARPYGGVEAFQEAISTRNYTHIGQVLRDYSGRMGVSLMEGARQIGELLGRREATGAFALGNALSAVGWEGIEHTETQKTLNEAAKMEQMYQIGRHLGLISDKKDFGGMFRGHLAHYAEETLTVPNEGVSQRLNQMAAEQGLTTRFFTGDRVRMAWTEGEDGLRLTLAKAEAGASSERLDITRMTSGLYSQLYNLSQAQGVISSQGTGIFNDKRFIGLLKESGANQVARDLTIDLAKGRQVYLESASFDPQTGQLTAFSLQRGGDYEIEDYTKTQTGWERVSRAVSREETGSIRQIWNNYVNRVGGSHSLTYENFRETMSGLRKMGFNIQTIEDASMKGGYRMMFQDPRSGRVVAGDIKSVVTAFKQTSDGATHEVSSPWTGQVLVSKSEFGQLREQFMNRLNMNMGVKVDGVVTEGARDVFGEKGAVFVGGGVDVVSTIGGVFGSFKNIFRPFNRTTGQSAPKTTGGTGGTTGKDLDRQRAEWEQYFNRAGTNFSSGRVGPGRSVEGD